MAIASIGFFLRGRRPPKWATTHRPSPSHPPARPLPAPFFWAAPSRRARYRVVYRVFFFLLCFFSSFCLFVSFCDKKGRRTAKKKNKKRISPFVCFAILARCHWLHGIAVTGFFYRVSPPPPPPPPPPPSCRNFPRAGESIKRV